MKKDFYIIIPFDSDENRSVRDNSFFWIFRNFWSAITSEETVWSIREKRRRADYLKKWNLERLNIIKTNLESIWLKANEVKKDDLIKLLINYYNPKINTELKLKSDIEKINFEM